MVHDNEYTLAEFKAEAYDRAMSMRTRTWQLWREMPLRLAQLATGALLLAVTPLVSSCQKRQNQEARPEVKLEVLRVDDSIDPFATLNEADVPAGLGIAIFAENIPVGKPSTVVTHYARIALRQGDSPATAIARARPWLDTLKLPAGARFGFEPSSEEEGKGSTVKNPIAVRTLVLIGDAAISTRDVKDAYVSKSSLPEEVATVGVELSPEGAAKFETFTREWTNRRAAIVVSDLVDSAPVIKAPISGGHMTISMGAGDPFERKAEAERLAKLLKPR